MVPGLAFTCDDLVEGVRNTLEKFFNTRMSAARRHRELLLRPASAQEFNLAYDQILGAMDRIVRRNQEADRAGAASGGWTCGSTWSPVAKRGISFWMHWREVLFSFFSLTPSVPPSGFVVDLGLEMGQEHASLVVLLELTESQED